MPTTEVHNGVVGLRFSVLLPVRDRADDVGRAVVSVLAQTFSGLELVVIDTGSTDGTRDAVLTVADRRVRILDIDAGAPIEALAAGLDAARGRWVAMIDPDTAVRPQWLARCGLLLDRSGADAVVCGGAQHHRDATMSEIIPTALTSRPAALVARKSQFPVRHGEAPDRCVCTPEPLVDWFDPRPPLETLGADRRLRWAKEAIAVLGDSPIPDADLLARYATIGGIAAARLHRRDEARSLLGMARRIRSGEIKPLARWIVASIPPLSNRIWNPEGA